MNPLQEAYLDGAAMAYNDVANKIDDMIAKAPPEIIGIMECIKPIAESCRLKAIEVSKEAERFTRGARQ